MGLNDLPDKSRVYLDSSIIIYAIEQVEPYFSVIDPFWKAITASRFTAMTSSLSLLETTVLPRRQSRMHDLSAFEKLFESSFLELSPVNLEVLVLGAKLRADDGALRTPDAIHQASAAIGSADVFLTNDKRWKRMVGAEVIYLNDLIDRDSK